LLFIFFLFPFFRFPLRSPSGVNRSLPSTFGLPSEDPSREDNRHRPERHRSSRWREVASPERSGKGSHLSPGIWIHGLLLRFHPGSWPRGRSSTIGERPGPDRSLSRNRGGNGWGRRSPGNIRTLFPGRFPPCWSQNPRGSESRFPATRRPFPGPERSGAGIGRRPPIGKAAGRSMPSCCESEIESYLLDGAPYPLPSFGPMALLPVPSPGP
jgi:hypothetical protein